MLWIKLLSGLNGFCLEGNHVWWSSNGTYMTMMSTVESHKALFRTNIVHRICITNNTQLYLSFELDSSESLEHAILVMEQCISQQYVTSEPGALP